MTTAIDDRAVGGSMSNSSSSVSRASSVYLEAIVVFVVSVVYLIYLSVSFSSSVVYRS